MDTVAAVGDGCAAGEAFDREAVRERSRLKRDFVVLAALTAAAPLLGLLGTVFGMVKTFRAVAELDASADLVAAGISQALVTTQVGLIVAIPGVFGLYRLHRLGAQFGVCLSACKARLLLGLAGHAGDRGASA
jgi:biopolymer transport protein ExbB/TolQ